MAHDSKKHRKTRCMQHKARPNYLREMFKLVRDFFRKDFIKEPIFEQSPDLRKIIVKMNIMTFIMNGLVFNIFSYLTLAGNYAIERGCGILGIVLYMLYSAQGIVSTVYHQWDRNVRTEISFAREDAMTTVGSSILKKVNFNVYQQKGNQWNQSTPEEITNCVANYLISIWDVINNYWIDILHVLTTIGMLILTVFTNRTIPQTQFIPLLVITATLCLFCSAIDRFNHANFREEDRELSNEKAVLKNDILRTTPIIPEDQDCRIRRYQALSHEHLDKKRNLINRDFGTDILYTTVHIIASCILIVLYVHGAGEISLSTVAGMTASLAIFNSAVKSFENIIHVFTERSQSWDTINKETPLMEIILKVYHKAVSNQPQSISSLPVDSFRISYTERSENDKPFVLSLVQNLVYRMGDVVVLTGASGSGKSTFLKVCTSRIMFRENTSKKIAPVNYMYYDESVDFGSMPLWDELFCLDKQQRVAPTPDELAKMEDILRNLKIYQEVSENCSDFWTWTQQHTGKELSRGQKQRLIIGKILFWLDDNIDIVALDECTSGLDAESKDLDNADAISILRYIISYCNADRKRILFLATHQNILSLSTHQLDFKRKNGETQINIVN